MTFCLLITQSAQRFVTGRVGSKPGDTTVSILCKEGKQTETTLRLATVGGRFSLRPRWLLVWSGVLACLLLADSLTGCRSGQVKWVGGSGSLKWKPKTEMKDGPTGCQTSSNIGIDSGSYVTVVLKEPTSSSFCDFVLAVIFHYKNLGTLC
jgi:hypothetical protein